MASLDSLVALVFIFGTLAAISSAEPTASEPDTSYETESLCRGEWKSPQNCNTFNCDYKANWEYIDDSDEIIFTISTKNRNKWTGIGFSENQAMPETDAILGLVEDSGRFFLMDGWLRAYEAPPLDPVQNLYNMSAWRENGITTLRFTRKRLTGDNRDFQFSDTNCPYLVFPVMGGVFNAVNKRIRKHETTPIISDRRVCIRSCRPSIVTTAAVITDPKQDIHHNKADKTEELDSPEVVPPKGSTPQTTEVPKTKDIEETNVLTNNLFTIEVKLSGVWRSGLAQKHSNEFKTMITNIKQQITNELNKNYPAISNPEVNDLTRADLTSNVIASIDLAVKSDNKNAESIVSSALTAIISDEQIGNLRVDPKYLKIVRKEDQIGSNPKQRDSTINFFGDDQTKWMIIFGGIAALIGLVLIQAFCMLWRDTKNKDNKQKNDKPAPDPQWKDYAAAVGARSGYGYDNYGADETDMPIKTNGHSLGRGEKMNSNKHLYKNTAEKLPQKYLSATLERHPSRTHRSHEMTSAYATHDRNLPYNRNSYAQPSYVPHLQPDFYFMPHQRRYSGEVVRVFVDYNSPQFGPK